jgi:transposase InsO family protein
MRLPTDSRHDFPRYPNLVERLEVTRPDQVWVADITYVRLREEFVYLAVVMDVFTRRVRGWELGRSLDQGLTLAALKRAMRGGRRPEVHHSDQGVQYAATAYTDLLAGRGVAISMATVGKPEENVSFRRACKKVIHPVPGWEVGRRALTDSRRVAQRFTMSFTRSPSAAAMGAPPPGAILFITLAKVMRRSTSTTASEPPVPPQQHTRPSGSRL